MLCESAAINNHSDYSGTLYRNLNASVPDPTFPTPTQKKSKSSNLAAQDYLISVNALGHDFLALMGKIRKQELTLQQLMRELETKQP